MVPGLFSRRRHDKKQMATLQSSQDEGKPYRFTTRSNRTVNPNTGDNLKRGSVVRTSTTTQAKSSPSTFQLKIDTSPGHVETTKKFVAGDYNKPGTPIIDRKTTPAVGASLKEDPSKTQARMKAQDEGQASYTAPGGKKEYSGRTTNTFRITPPSVKSSMTVTPGTPEIQRKSALTITKPSAGAGGGPFTREKTNVVPWISGMSKGGQKSMSRFGGTKSFSYRHRAKKNMNP